MSMQRCFAELGSRCQKVNMEQPSTRAKKWQPKWKRNQSNWHNCILNIHEGPAHSYFLHIPTHNVMGYCTRVRITFKVVMLSRLPYLLPSFDSSSTKTQPMRCRPSWSLQKQQHDKFLHPRSGRKFCWSPHGRCLAGRPVIGFSLATTNIESGHNQN